MGYALQNQNLSDDPMYLLSLLLILLCLHQITSVVTVLPQLDILMQAVQPSLSIQIAVSLAWAIGSGTALLRLWRRSPWASAQAVGILLGFAAYSLLRLLLGARADYDRGRGLLWGILLGVIGVVSVVLWWRIRSNSGMGIDGESKS